LKVRAGSGEREGEERVRSRRTYMIFMLSGKNHGQFFFRIAPLSIRAFSASLRAFSLLSSSRAFC
jgi:hypothetical protein